MLIYCQKCGSETSVEQEQEVNRDHIGYYTLSSYSSFCCHAPCYHDKELTDEVSQLDLGLEYYMQ